MNHFEELTVDSCLASRLRDLFSSGVPAYLQVDPIEYHGPHLSLDNDFLLSGGLLRDLHSQLVEGGYDWPLVLAEPIREGCDPCPGPGSLQVSYRHLRRRVDAACRNLYQLGAKRIVLCTFHGAPLHGLALAHGARAVTKKGVVVYQPFNLVLSELLSLDAHEYRETCQWIEDPKDRKAVLDNLWRDFHAGFFESSMALHYAPETVDSRYKGLPPCPEFGPSALQEKIISWLPAPIAQEMRFIAMGLAFGALRPFPAYTGFPHLASARAGKVFAQKIVGTFANAARKVFEGENPPGPILPWLSIVSLGGKLGGGFSVPLDQVRVDF